MSTTSTFVSTGLTMIAAVFLYLLICALRAWGA